MLAPTMPENAEKIKPACIHFGECGGCLFQDFPYSTQIKAKENYLEKLFEKRVPVIPSPKEFFYRNRIDLACESKKIGLRNKSKKVFSLKECRLHSKKVKQALPKIKPLAKEIPSLNYLVFRHAKFSGQHMLAFVTSSASENISRKIEKTADEIKNEFDSVVWIMNSKKETSFGRIEKFWKKAFIEETLGNVTLRINANTFFQNNSFVAEKLFSEIKKTVSGRVLDLYAGNAAISCFVSDKCSYVKAVEINPEAVDCGQENFSHNNISNAKIIQQDTKKFLEKQESPDFDFVILDPPRAGLEKALQPLLKHLPENIVYVSCNPIALRRELFFFKKHYQITSLKAFDMFPQTPHTEVLCIMQKK